MLLVTAPVLVLLTWLVRTTRQGKAMRATSQDPEAAAIMGIDVNRTISFTFALAGGLAGIGAVLFLVEFNMRYDTGFQLGLIAFTAAVLGGIGNLTGAVLGAILIGLLQAFNEGLPWYAPGPDWTRSIVFAILIAILVFRPGGPARRTYCGGGVVGIRKEVSSTLRLDAVSRRWNRLPERSRSFSPVALLLSLAILYPWYVEGLPSNVPIINTFPSIHSMVTILIFVMMAVGLNVVVGYAGLLDLGYVAFYAIGAYTAGWFASGQFEQVNFHFGSIGFGDRSAVPGIHISMWLVFLIAAIITAIGGVLIGLPTLRLRGDYLAIVTLGFGEIIPQAVRNGDDIAGHDITNGTFGISPIDSPGFGEKLHEALGLPVTYQQSLNADELFYWTVLALLMITIFCSWRLRDSRLGRAWIAIREDETAAGAMGVPLMRTKTWAYAIGAFFGGIAGAYVATFNSGAFPSQFDFNISIFLLCMVILGGMGSLWGVVVAGFILAWLNVEGLANIGAWLNNNIFDIFGFQIEVPKYSFGIYGFLIVMMMLFRPTGLIPERRRKLEIEEGSGQDPIDHALAEAAAKREDE